MYRLIESERLPSIVAPGDFHYSKRFEMAALSCPCGCGHRVMLNLLDQHALDIKKGLPSICPSILVADAPCLSHFWIREGEVLWAEKWSRAKVDRVMARQVQRHMAGTNGRLSVRQKLARWFHDFIGR